MAINKSPKVQTARKVAEKYKKTHVILLMLDTKNGTIEYASYGKTAEACNLAKHLADLAYDEVLAEYQAM